MNKGSRVWEMAAGLQGLSQQAGNYGNQAGLANQSANLGLAGISQQAGNAQNANTGMQQGYMNAAGLNTDYANLYGQSNALSQQGISNLGLEMNQAALPRELQAQQSAANYTELQRLQQMLEQAVNAPFGALAGAGVGQMSQTTSSGGGK